MAFSGYGQASPLLYFIVSVDEWRKIMDMEWNSIEPEGMKLASDVKSPALK